MAAPAARVRSLIAPSLLSSDFAQLAREAKRMIDCGADWLHMDIMVRIRTGRARPLCRMAHDHGISMPDIGRSLCA